MANAIATSVPAPLGIKKPLVKEFFDRDAEAETFLKLRLPHVSRAIPSIKKLFSSKNGKTHKYRINWFATVESELVSVSKIVESKYVEVSTTKEGKVISFRIIG